MRILAVNGSPRGAAGNTDVLTRAFLQGAAESGADAETVYLKDAKIEHCIGCYSCWTRTPGVCVHRDDMPPILEKVQRADLLIWATPLYVYTVSGLTKDCMDRLLPLAQPFIVKHGEHFVHPPRYPRQSPRRTVLISNCGFPESHHFAGLKETFRVWVSNSGQSLAGTICCAGGPMLQEPRASEVTSYLDAVRVAGREVALGRPIPLEIQAVVDRPLIDNAGAYSEQINRMWRAMGIRETHHDAGGVRPEA